MALVTTSLSFDFGAAPGTSASTPYGVYLFLGCVLKIEKNRLQQPGRFAQ
jgi:hypothetical protein